jgi:transposase InsO family protein
MRLHAIACDVLARPVYLCAARSPHVVDLTLLPRGLHEEPRDLRTRLQAVIDGLPAGYDAIVLGYGLCGGATAGIEARDVPVVLPRAHDCITLFLGARERYDAEVLGRDPTYWYVADQLERPYGAQGGRPDGGLGAGGDTEDEMEALHAEYVAKYGEDNADYLMEVMGAWRTHYRRGAFIELGVADEAHASAIAREQAERRGWRFETVEGSLVLLRRLFEGDWNEDILVLRPGERLAMSYDDSVVKAVPAGRSCVTHVVDSTRALVLRLGLSGSNCSEEGSRVAHPRPRLSVFSRQLLVRRVQAGWPAAQVAEQLGISRATAYKWVRRYRAEGEDGLLDRSSRPLRSPRRTAEAVESRILAARAEWRYGPDRLGPLLGLPPSTVHRVLHRRGFSRLRDADRVTAAPVRYQACHPGALLHQDHKKLGRIPDGGGWRVLGRGQDRTHGHSGAGYEHLEVVIDDASRYAVVVPVPDESGRSAAHALEVAATEFARLGIRIERVMTDNAFAYIHSTRYRAVLDRIGARHKRTRPRRPQTNGKAERVIQTLLNEWAYARPYTTNREREEALPVFVDFYNRGRPHTALGGRSPLDVVNNVLGDHS